MLRVRAQQTRLVLMQRVLVLLLQGQALLVQPFRRPAQPRKLQVLMMLQALEAFAVLPPAQQVPLAAPKAQYKRRI